jgi:hypothetical protein
MTQVGVDPQVDYPLLVARNAREVFGLEGFANDLGYTRPPGLITVGGWQRIDELRSSIPKSRQAFVAMWFDPELSNAYESGFKPGIEDSDYYEAQRMDRKEHNEKIDDEIVAEIRRSGLVVADFTGHRGGTYYEAGFAQGLGIPVVWTCRKDHVSDLHFDTRQCSHIVWATPDDLRKRLDARIRATVLPRPI